MVLRSLTHDRTVTRAQLHGLLALMASLSLAQHLARLPRRPWPGDVMAIWRKLVARQLQRLQHLVDGRMC